METLEIPYRLETTAAILTAMRNNLLDIGSGYINMLALAKKEKLYQPPALLNACKSVIKYFTLIREEKKRESYVQYHKLEGLDLISNFQLIETAIPWASQLAEHDNIFSLVGSLSQEAQQFFGLEKFPSTPMQMLESVFILQKLIRKEMLTYMAARKTKISIEEIKILLVSLTLYDPRNEDILRALKSEDINNKSALYQNAVAELLLSRLPRSMEELFYINPKVIRQKLFSKIVNLNLTVKNKVMLHGFFPPNIANKNIVSVLCRVDSIVQKISLPKEMMTKLHNYITSLKYKIDYGQKLYEELFLNDDLKIIKKLYLPKNIMECKFTYKEVMLKTHTRLATLQFYPTKDYLDLFRKIGSDDCIGVSIGEQQLMTPNFFNIRIFNDTRWTGNIYMLDFIEEHGVLLVDRIQIPRGINAYYVYFFQDLREMFQEMFQSVDYKEILLPINISNHAAIQKIFNTYKEKLPRRKIDLNIPQAEHFESLRKMQKYYVLCKKP